MALPQDIEQKLSVLTRGVDQWKTMPNADRAVIARQCKDQLATLDMAWVADNLRCLGIEPSRRDATNALGFDPMLFVSVVGERLDKIATALEGKYKMGEGILQVARQVEGICPTSVYAMGDLGMAAPKCSLEVWSNPSVPEPTASERGGLCVVLGAGNQNFLTGVDVIERAFMHKECVLLKQHPIRPFMAAPFEHIFQPLARLGAYAQCLDSDLDGRHAGLVSHGSVSHVHMTGSGATLLKITQALSAAGRDDVGVTSELGCVTPWIICPGVANEGQWKEAELDHHATMLAAAFKSSCSMNCLSPKALVLPSAELWPQRSAFLALLRTKLGSMPQSPPYYPGAHARYNSFKAQYPDNQEIHAPSVQEAGVALTSAPYTPFGQDFSPLPSMLVDVGVLGSPSCRSFAVTNEAFSPILAIATVDSNSAKEYPIAAARAVNKNVFGTLSCNLMFPDGQGADLDAVVGELNYGCVAVNMWAAVSYSNALGVWGGAPGSYSKEQPESGDEFVGNVAGIPHVSKAVALSPFLNAGVRQAKAMPMVVLDSLLVLSSGQKHAVPKIMGIVFGRAFGLLPRRMPAASSDLPKTDSEVQRRRGLQCFNRPSNNVPLASNRA